VPISPWLNVIGVAPFAVQHVATFQGRPVQTWVYRQDRDAGFHDFAVPTLDVLDFYDRRVGPFAYEKLANVQANGVRGGMESATAVFYGDDSVTGTRSVRWRNVVIHEIAHQWFGNTVTEHDWDDVWLSEGFATYFTLLFIEHAYGRDEFLAGVRRSRDMVRAFEEKNPGYRVIHDNLSDMSKVTTSQTYQKGAWVLHMLRGLIGDDAFWQGIRTYYRTHFNGTASTEQFRRIMEQASGQPLGWFFDQWLRRGGWATVTGTWRYDPSLRAAIVELHQRPSDGTVFRLPLEIAVQVVGEQAPRVQRVELTGARGVFTIPSPQAPQAVHLDPGTWVLMDATLTEDPRPAGTAPR
jgi:aminopeptidase N